MKHRPSIMLMAATALTGLAVTSCSAPNRSPQMDGGGTGGSSQPRNAGPADAAVSSGTGNAAAGRGGPPGVAPSAAPGVAFNYDYAFRLDAERIGELQEAHAQACEALTIQRCRVTGVYYRQQDNGEVEAMLRLSLDPAIARRFGRDAQTSVAQAGGALVESNMRGEDVGTAIQANTRSIDQLRQDLARVEQQIADANVAEPDKIGLRAQADEIRQRIRDIEAARSDQQQTLATTPVTFRYGSGDFAGDRPNFSAAVSQVWTAILWGLYGLMVVLALLAPWVLLGLGIWWVVRWAIRRSRRHAPAWPVPGAGPPPVLDKGPETSL